MKLTQYWNNILFKFVCSMDLMCWLDIEEFKKTLNKDKEKSDRKSKDIKTKYLNNKYFFGPNSPATRKQQEKVAVTEPFMKNNHCDCDWDKNPQVGLLQLFPKVSPQILPIFWARNLVLFWLDRSLPVQAFPPCILQNISLKWWSEATARACTRQLRKSVKITFRHSDLFQLSILVCQ